MSPSDDLELEPTANILKQLFPKTEGTVSRQCPADRKMLGSCERLGATTESGADWLECWRYYAKDDILNLGEIFNWRNAKCCLTNEQKTIIGDACKDKTTMPDVVVCAGQMIRTELKKDPEKVCRHHARCLKEVLALTKARVGGNMFGGISSNFEGGAIPGDPEGGHAWTEIGYGGLFSQVWNGGHRIFADAYNGIYIQCTGRNRTVREVSLRGLL